MLVLIQPIFAPNEDQLAKNIKSIQSLIDYLNEYPFKIKFVTGGWCVDDTYWNIFQRIFCDFHPDVEIVYKKFDQNYGKAYVVNTLYQQHVSTLPFDYFMTIDSDMLFDKSCSNMFTKLLALAPAIEDCFEKSLGMLALQQHQANCHVITDNWTKSLLLNMKIYQPDTSYGLAGGAILVSKKAWNKINGYRILNVYGGNDGWYLNDCATFDFWYGLVDDLYMTHPFENDEKYSLWKREQIENHLNDGASISQDELKKRAVLSNQIWNE